MQPERGGAIDLEIDLGDNRPFRPRLPPPLPRDPTCHPEELLLLSTLSHDELLLLEGVGRGSLASRWVRRSHRLPADGSSTPVRVPLGRYDGCVHGSWEWWFRSEGASAVVRMRPPRLVAHHVLDEGGGHHALLDARLVVSERELPNGDAGPSRGQAALGGQVESFVPTSVSAIATSHALCLGVASSPCRTFTPGAIGPTWCSSPSTTCATDEHTRPPPTAPPLAGWPARAAPPRRGPCSAGMGHDVKLCRPWTREGGSSRILPAAAPRDGRGEGRRRALAARRRRLSDSRGRLGSRTSPLSSHAHGRRDGGRHEAWRSSAHGDRGEGSRHGGALATKRRSTPRPGGGAPPRAVA